VTGESGLGHPLLDLQRLAGNRAVSGLFGRPTVQRIWEYDDEETWPEETPLPEDEGDSLPFSIDPATDGRAIWSGWVGPGQVQMGGQPVDPGDAACRVTVERSAQLAYGFAARQPYEPIPEGIAQGGGGWQMFITNPFGDSLPASDTRDLLARQAMRHVAGTWSPDIMRLVNATPGAGGPGQPGGGGGSGGQPGGGQSGGGTQPGGGGIPGMEPVPGGGKSGGGPGTQPGGGGIPGMEPMPGGGQAAGWPNPPIPGLLPVPPQAGPGIEPATGGGAGGEAGANGPAHGKPMLRSGSAGDEVREMQNLLVRHGATIEADGQFGGLTRAAVVDFQRGAGLGADGIVGPKTWEALEAG